MHLFSASSVPVKAAMRVYRTPKRLIALNRNSTPFLSGDAFADFSDFQFYPPKYRRVESGKISLASAKIVFCPSHRVEEFFEEFGSYINAKVLIFGNSDREFSESNFNMPKSVKHVFAQNLLVKNSKWVTGIPIGLENLRLAANGYPKLLKKSAQRIDSKILIGPFGLTHDERRELVEQEFSLEDRITFCSERLTPKQYSKLASRYSYIVAPRGNGIDTHRLWETLYRGAIPIVRRSQWLENFSFLDKLVIKVDSWDVAEIVECVERSRTSLFNPSEKQELWWPYWESTIKRYL
jgi:hypothetical protein